ncbi:MAG TPA: HEAT repeat domain-containing protein [Longimicrobiales bacterium]
MTTSVAVRGSEMKSGRGGRLAFVLLAASLALPPASAAQSLASRIAAAPDGTVRMSFAARPGVCGDGRNIVTQRRTADWESDCESGPVRVVLAVRDGTVTHVRTYVGGRWRPGDATVTDLGTVAASAAAHYLVGLAAHADDEVAKKAILPATLADSAEIWPELLDIARDRSRPREARRAAVFWLGQEAGRAVAGPLEALATDRTDDQRVREHAVFVLSQLPDDEGIPALIRLARTHSDPEIRKTALFWLAQSEDPRALAVFEEILVKH